VSYSHGSNAPDLEEALIARYPSVMFGHDFYGTCGTGSKCHSFPNPRPCTRTFGPMCLLLHYPRRCGALNPIEALSTFRIQARRRALLPRYDAVVVASGYMREEFRRHEVAPDRLHVLTLPIDVPASDAPPFAAAAADRQRVHHIVTVGRLTDLKGAHYLIRAIPEASRQLGVDIALGLLGTGPEEARLKSLAQGVGVHATFHGWVDPGSRNELLRRADLLAVPSLWPEPFGLVGVEAGRLGLPAVGYAVGGIPDWLIPGQTGELAPGDPPTVAGLTGAIVRALRDPAHHAALRRGAWEQAQQFTMAAHLDRLEPLFARVAAGRR
jgi:glycosyltransferase involved in cell wall biosynthesis